MNEQELIERVMETHWDIDACTCIFCCESRELGYRPKIYPKLDYDILEERPRRIAFPGIFKENQI